MRVLIVSNTDWSFWVFRRPLLRALQQQGWEAHIVCPPGSYTKRLIDQGFSVILWKFKRRTLHPVYDAKAAWDLWRIYSKWRPTVVHHFTIKPIIYGSLIARRLRVKGVINTWAGLGWTFSNTPKARIVRIALLPVLRSLSRWDRLWTVSRNHEDLKLLQQLGIANKKRSFLIPTEGVDTQSFPPRNHSNHTPPMVFMASRLLWDKGVGEFVESAKILRQKGVEARFVIAGEPDPGNPSCIPESVLQQWRQEGVVEFLGYREDIPSLLQEANIAVLPSYYEGLPRFVLEAMASGVPVVATDIPGCRMAVQHGVNGLLVPPGNAQALADAILHLLKQPQLREELGRAGRTRAAALFHQQRMIRAWIELYKTVVKNHQRQGEKHE